MSRLSKAHTLTIGIKATAPRQRDGNNIKTGRGDNVFEGFISDMTCLYTTVSTVSQRQVHDY